ncbi:10917_t:CDS:2, partial [Rhizophagus irregularis]
QTSTANSVAHGTSEGSELSLPPPLENDEETRRDTRAEHQGKKKEKGNITLKRKSVEYQK